MTSLKKLASLVNGVLSGDSSLEIKRVSPPETAGPEDLVIILEKKALAPALNSKAKAFVVPAGIEPPGRSFISVMNPRLAMAQVLSLYAGKTAKKAGVHKSAVISPSAKIGKRVTIHPLVYVGEGCEVGDDSIIYPSVTLYDGVKIGKRVIIHSGACIGVDGYGYVQQAGRHIKIPQIGKVVIEDDVEIYANVTIARATLGVTRIGRGTKIDCLTHVGHNCNLGEDCAIVSLVGLSGSVTLKDRVSVGGQAGFSGHNTIGENSILMARSGITKDIPPNSIVSGFPAQDHSAEMRFQAALRRLASKVEK